MKDKILNDIIKLEGDYTNNSNDLGGETKYGIIKQVVKDNGYTGSILPV